MVSLPVNTRFRFKDIIVYTHNLNYPQDEIAGMRTVRPAIVCKIERI